MELLAFFGLWFRLRRRQGRNQLPQRLVRVPFDLHALILGAGLSLAVNLRHRCPKGYLKCGRACILVVEGIGAAGLQAAAGASDSPGGSGIEQLRMLREGGLARGRRWRRGLRAGAVGGARDREAPRVASPERSVKRSAECLRG